ncbi:MAG: tRNA (guanosine(37)-N1)-methyltransferase TrmD [bacterium]|nr:tRNA (guanosine(37)-N1)-methyltransferase TrmD [bacterium]
MTIFHIYTIFPKIFSSYFNESILKRSQEKNIIKIKIYNIRDFAEDKHKTTDDRPYGGGAGMLMKPLPIIKAVEKILSKIKGKKAKIVLFSAKGKQFNQETAFNWSKKYTDILMICGRYEGIDERVKKVLKAQEISIGPYVLTDGEIPAMILVSSISRLIPGAICWESLKEESFFSEGLKKEKKGLLEYPHYTRPEVFEFKGKKYRVPKVLLSGDHKQISNWRLKHGKPPHQKR